MDSTCAAAVVAAVKKKKIKIAGVSGSTHSWPVEESSHWWSWGDYGVRRLTTVIAIAAIFSCIYASLLVFTSGSGATLCWNSVNCQKPPPVPVCEKMSLKLLPLARAYAASSSSSSSVPSVPSVNPSPAAVATNLSHIVFGIAASASLWERRKEYIKLWWRPAVMRGYVWLDKAPSSSSKVRDRSLPALRISKDTSQFKYTNPRGHRSAIRISRIVSETVRLRLRGGEIRWIVMGDDDTVFVAENLVRVLSKYDHRQYYYIGSNSESHLQNIMLFSYNMAYGGGGFAISYPLALALEKMQDQCLARYPYLFGSDDRIQACMAELGVPLTREPGFHQYDVYGNLFGLMAAHPLVPVVSLHHLDVVDPVFPNRTRVDALRHLSHAVNLDPAGFLQQAICYDADREWSVSVSWGYAVQVFRGIIPARELELPARTFYNWHKKADYTAYAFNTRPFARNTCQRPFRFYMTQADRARTRGGDSSDGQRLISWYVRKNDEPSSCRWNLTSPTTIDKISVLKRFDKVTSLNQALRRKCCRVVSTDLKRKKMGIEIGDCQVGQIIAVPNKKQRPLLVRIW